MPCTECPKRAGNTALLFDDCAQDTCTDRPCFNRKVNAWIDVQLAAAAQEKRKLLKLTDNWTSDKDKVHVNDYGGARLLKTASECPHGEQGIWVDGRNAGQVAVVCRKADCKTHHGQSSRGSSSSRSSSTKSTEAEKAERRKVLDKVKEEKAYRAALFAAILGAPVNGAADELNLRVCAALMGETDSLYLAKFAEALAWDKKTFEWGGDKKLAEKLKPMSAVERLRLALLSTEAGELGVHEYSLGGKPDGLEKLARLLNVDPKKIREQSAAAKVDEVKAVPAAAEKPPSKKSAGKSEKKKTVLSAAARKRIKEAQQKRWKAAMASAKKAGRK